MESFTVKAYKFIEEKYELMAWAAGLNHQHADKYYKQLRDTNSFAKLEMFRDNLN
jgi:hypothetical protein